MKHLSVPRPMTMTAANKVFSNEIHPKRCYAQTLTRKILSHTKTLSSPTSFVFFIGSFSFVPSRSDIALSHLYKMILSNKIENKQLRFSGFIFLIDDYTTCFQMLVSKLSVSLLDLLALSFSCLNKSLLSSDRFDQAFFAV